MRRPRRLVVPLSAEQVAQFWRSFRHFRDLSLIALMLLDGLRSQELLRIELEDLRLAQAQLWVHGKGHKDRLLSLPAEAVQALENYLHLERPLTNSPRLFVSLQGPRRGQPMTPAGLRSLFRYHRRRSQVPQANPHRFRHTFGADMVRAGISLPALMRLMGHAHIYTTMLYVNLSPQDVWREFHRALQESHSPPSAPTTMSRPTPTRLEQIFTAQMRTLAAVLQPSTVRYYQSHLNRFLRYLHTAFPQVRTPSQLRRDPHVLGWLHSLTAQTPPLSNRTRRAGVICLRRLLEDLASGGHRLATGLLLRQDLPPQDLYLPPALPPETDHRLQEELRRTDDLHANTLLLLRATGMRIGECLRLRTDCLRHLGGEDWAIHVPLGKLHTERWVPVDAEARHFLARILSLRGTAPSQPADAPDWLLRRVNGRRLSYQDMRAALQEAARRSGWQTAVRLHRLRHTYASEMLRAGASLPAVKEMLGHKNIRMTMVYIQITQNDLQREYHQARQNSAHPHPLPPLLAAASAETLTGATIPAICRSLAATRHLLEMYRRQLGDEPARRKVGRLLNRLAKIAAQLIRAEK